MICLYSIVCVVSVVAIVPFMHIIERIEVSQKSIMKLFKPGDKILGRIISVRKICLIYAYVFHNLILFVFILFFLMTR
jgi:hypothetical protein